MNTSLFVQFCSWGSCSHYYELAIYHERILHDVKHKTKGRELQLLSDWQLKKTPISSLVKGELRGIFLSSLEKRWREISRVHCILFSVVIDDVITWKHLLHWPFVRGIHRSPMNSPHKGKWRWAMICAWTNAWVNNQDADYLRPLRPLWRHCNVVCRW